MTRAPRNSDRRAIDETCAEGTRDGAVHVLPPKAGAAFEQLVFKTAERRIGHLDGRSLILSPLARGVRDSTSRDRI